MILGSLIVVFEFCENIPSEFSQAHCYPYSLLLSPFTSRGLPSLISFFTLYCPQTLLVNVSDPSQDAPLSELSLGMASEPCFLTCILAYDKEPLRNVLANANSIFNVRHSKRGSKMLCSLLNFISSAYFLKTIKEY